MPRVPDEDLTIAPTDATPPVTPAAHRFAPGAIVAGRYRLVALLGRGGMGEVYRADDLTLDQPVALKFLPVMEADGDTSAARAGHVSVRLAQFHNELRIARQVSHKNVCRLYDLGEADGRRFLTMEYVDGEDLASLLRRIGRLPSDKAIEIARQLCAGLAAAHERGVLHRDLKPANVMLDGDGNVRVADFGLAIADGTTDAALAGTPQYMAPEQLKGQPASVRSDIYALGLVLFEIFTGRRAYEAKSLDDLMQFHQSGTVTTPTSVVRDLDPAIERVILRCLERDPARRPASALGVAAALPVGDPLAAALAAGETPSPDMLEAAGEADALGVARGLAIVGSVAAGLLMFASLSSRTSFAGRVPLEKPPAVLVDRAREVVALLGYERAAGDRGYGWTLFDEYTSWIQQTDQSPRRWDVLSIGSPSALRFWYRTSPRPMLPIITHVLHDGDPAATESDMRTVVLDSLGRLQEFHSVPPQFDAETSPAPAPRWEALFEAAALPIASFSSVSPEWAPPDFADTRAAWEGPLPGQQKVRVRVEAAAYRGRPVSFSVIGPWTQPRRMQGEDESLIDRVIIAVIILIVAVLFVGAAFLARDTVRRNRADLRGAGRLTAFVLALFFVDWLVSAHHLGTVELEFVSFVRASGSVVFGCAVLWVVYLALEPYVRRFWPDSLLGWTRLVSGHIRDPRVGRDVLAGVAVGVLLLYTELGKALLVPMLGFAAPVPAYGRGVSALAGPGLTISAWLQLIYVSLLYSMLIVLAFVVLRLLFRRAWLTVTVGTVFLSILQMQNINGNGVLIVVLFPIAAGILLSFVILRFGLLTLAVALFVKTIGLFIPWSLDVSSWAAVPSIWSLAALTGLALFAFYASRAGQPLFGRALE